MRRHAILALAAILAAGAGDNYTLICIEVRRK